jgi:hypothetical protein
MCAACNQFLGGEQMQKFPRQPENNGGWTINTELLRIITKQLEKMEENGENADAIPSWEQIEMVLLAVEVLPQAPARQQYSA